jgi:hypothetical protein
MATPMTTSCIRPTLTGPSGMRWSNHSDGSCCGSEPQTLVATFCRMIEKPSVESSGVISGALRSGWYATFSITSAIAAAPAIPAAMATASGSLAMIAAKPRNPPIMNSSAIAMLRMPRIPITSENESATSV